MAAHTPAFARLNTLLRTGVDTETGRGLADVSMSRRGALATLGAAALGAVGCGTKQKTPNEPALATTPVKSESTVLIVGAGVAGLNCAYQLNKQQFTDIKVMEAATRVGGRMFTERTHFAPNVDERGGQFFDTRHVNILRAAVELGIKIDDLDPPDRGKSLTLFHFGGKVRSERELLAAFKPVADRIIKAQEAADKNPAERARLGRMNIMEWLDSVPEVEPWLRELLRVTFTHEMGLDAEETNAWNLLEVISTSEKKFDVFGDSDMRFHTHEGNDTIPRKMMEALPSGTVELGARLVRVEGADGGYRATFEREGAPSFSRTCQYLVLAIPFTILRTVDMRVEMEPMKRRVINELGYGTNARVMGKFSAPVWLDKHGSNGSVYADNAVGWTWDSSRGQPERGVITNFLGGKRGLDANKGTPEERFAELRVPFEKIFPGVDRAYVHSSAFVAHWASNEFSKGSYSCYKPGQDIFAGHEGKRIGGIFTIGEHANEENQSFMEGAYISGGEAAADILFLLKFAERAAQVPILGERDAWVTFGKKN